MPVDLIQNIPGFGDAADRLLANNGDIGVLRPWLGRDGRSYCSKMVFNDRTGLWEPKIFVSNTPATLTYDQWKQYDTSIVRAVYDRLRFVADIRKAGLVYNLPNGMAHTVLQYQTMGDITPATVSMDPIRRSEGDRPQIDLNNLPLPVIHKDFDFSARQIMTSRYGLIPMPLDTTTGEIAGRKVAEEAENMAVGNVGSAFTFSGGKVYGAVNFPNRVTKTDMPTPDGTNGQAVVNAFLALRQSLINNKHYGPYTLYANDQWAQWMDSDFSTAKGDLTLRQRLLAVDGFQDIRILDRLPKTKYDAVMLEMSTETIRMVIGMEVQTVQWESMGGLMKHFKVMCLIVPQFRPDVFGNSGVAHGTNS